MIVPETSSSNQSNQFDQRLISLQEDRKSSSAFLLIRYSEPICLALTWPELINPCTSAASTFR